MVPSTPVVAVTTINNTVLPETAALLIKFHDETIMEEEFNGAMKAKKFLKKLNKLIEE